ncbi:hypothetical protein [Ralstonia pseudosolanacearum]|uniref:hypothetical protein n=1 Tax=Ralstonia pseudosolanacearum TaxID=1310165 RepID=UPI001FF9BBFD|nr:hypothetical protein [Ralstonia pseudosolanacearum]
MTMIRVTGWKTGFNKVQFGSLLRELCGFSLSEGKRCVDTVLQGEPIAVTITQERTAHFLERASLLGAVCELAEE